MRPFDESEAAEASDLPALERELITCVAEQASASDGGQWSVALPDDSIVLMHTTRHV